MSDILIKTRKVKNDLIYNVLDQFGDTTGGVTSQMISEKIREATGHEVDNQYIEDFMNGIAMRLQSILTTLVLEISSGVFVGALTSAEVVGRIKANRQKIFDWLKNIPTSAGKGSKGAVFNAAMSAGKGASSMEIAKINSTFETFMTCQNLGLVVDGSTSIASNVNQSLLSARSVEGDNRMLGSTQILKAVLEFKATAKQGF